MSRISIPLKWFGGKYYLAPQIIAMFPPHTHYVEPFLGGGAVLLAHSGEGRSELVNDLNLDLTNFWTVLQNDVTFAHFQRIVEAVPLSRNEWDAAGDFLGAEHSGETFASYGGASVVRAVAFFVRCRQSLAGRMNSFTPPTRTRTRRNMNGNVSEWLGAVEGLPAVHARLRRVFVESMDAMKLMKREDGPSTLIYADPPYLHETRASKDVYKHEMTADQHAEFLAVAKSLKAKVMISGYASPMYDCELSAKLGSSASAVGRWSRHTFDLPNNSAGGKTKRTMTEVVWCNF